MWLGPVSQGGAGDKNSLLSPRRKAWYGMGTVQNGTEFWRELTMPAAKAAGSNIIEIPRIDAETLIVPILGTSPLLIHRFSEKAKKQMLDNMQGRKTPKQAKDPDAEYQAAFYRTNDGRFGIPVIAFKAATIGGARFFSGVTMTLLRQVLFFRGEVGVDGQQLAIIDGEPKMREDVVRVGNGGTDLRYRPEFPEWKTELRVTYVTSQLTQQSVLSLIDAGGMGVGVGEWRPERKGDMGCFMIDPDRPIEAVTNATNRGNEK